MGGAGSAQPLPPLPRNKTPSVCREAYFGNYGSSSSDSAPWGRPWGAVLPVIPTNINKSRVLACLLSSGTWQAAWQIKQHGSSKGLQTECLGVEKSTEGRLGLAEAPLASIPWAYNEVGPKSMACNYSIKTFQGTYPLLSLEMSSLQPLCHQ